MLITLLLLLTPPETTTQSISLLGGAVKAPVACHHNVIMAIDTLMGSIRCPNGGSVWLEGGYSMPDRCREESPSEPSARPSSQAWFKVKAGARVSFCIRPTLADKSQSDFVIMIPDASTALFASLGDPASVSLALELAASFRASGQ